MKKKKTVTDVETQMQALKGVADHFNSDLTEVIARDKDEQLLTVSVHAKGQYAIELERWLKRIHQRNKE